MPEPASGVSQLATFILVTDMYRLGNFPLSLAAHSHLGMSSGLSACRIAVTFITTYLQGFSWYLNSLSWVLAVAVSVIIVYTGAAANRGERWAAGNRMLYGAIPG